MFYLFIILIQMKILLNSYTLNRKLRLFNDIGFVPTMGGIHKGHISLINRSKKLCKKTIVSIFVNPKQFNNKDDFKSYPTDIKKDLSILKKIKGIDFVYIPKFNNIYDSKKKSKIILNKNDRILCAKFRKDHFEGVLEVMDRLTDQIKPNKIFLGKKDFQQLYLIKNFIEKKYNSKVIACKTIRDNNKLALSTRNYLLNNNDLDIARNIAKKMFDLKKIIKNKININNFLLKEKNKLQKKFKVKFEYIECRNENNFSITNKFNKSKIFIAYYIKKIRLIDNF